MTSMTIEKCQAESDSKFPKTYGMSLGKKSRDLNSHREESKDVSSCSSESTEGASNRTEELHKRLSRNTVGRRSSVQYTFLDGSPGELDPGSDNGQEGEVNQHPQFSKAMRVVASLEVEQERTVIQELLYIISEINKDWRICLKEKEELRECNTRLLGVVKVAQAEAQSSRMKVEQLQLQHSSVSFGTTLFSEDNELVTSKDKYPILDEPVAVSQSRRQRVVEVPVKALDDQVPASFDAPDEEVPVTPHTLDSCSDLRDTVLPFSSRSRFEHVMRPSTSPNRMQQKRNQMSPSQTAFLSVIYERDRAIQKCEQLQKTLSTTESLVEVLQHRLQEDTKVMKVIKKSLSQKHRRGDEAMLTSTKQGHYVRKQNHQTLSPAKENQERSTHLLDVLSGPPLTSLEGEALTSPRKSRLQQAVKVRGSSRMFGDSPSRRAGPRRGIYRGKSFSSIVDGLVGRTSEQSGTGSRPLVVRIERQMENTAASVNEDPAMNALRKSEEKFTPRSHRQTKLGRRCKSLQSPRRTSKSPGGGKRSPFSFFRLKYTEDLTEPPDSPSVRMYGRTCQDQAKAFQVVSSFQIPELCHPSQSFNVDSPDTEIPHLESESKGQETTCRHGS